MEALTVGASIATVREVGERPAPWVRLVPVDGTGGPTIPAPVALWRRQPDRTAWLMEALRQHPTVRWVHTDTAGVDRLPLDDLRADGVVLSNARGVYSPAVAEWAVAALLLAAKRFDIVVRRSDAGTWAPAHPARQLSGAGVVVLGLGSIGSAVAAACRSLGMRVIGVVRDPSAHAQDRRADEVVGADQDWRRMLSQASYLVVTAPLTRHTRGLLDATTLGLLPAGAWIVNVARGEIIDEAALVKFLDAGRLGGAVLDAFSREPLPAEHPLWNRDNVLVSPHASGNSTDNEPRTRALFLSEAQLVHSGALPVNTCDYDRGY